MRVASSAIPSRKQNFKLPGDATNQETEFTDTGSNESPLDSDDDDLTPYNMSNDVEYKQVQKTI